ncbi:MarR family winged helix-turn-helix transcriptional regulator [Lactobacillus isalae]|uniref:MarR family winged helix-turn-helix transcriptional regulator n=1 Tax=Lactobacillus isalae TaxID=2993455 RepID=UPI0024A87BB2|nr:MarR family transcriptional regulator [Lactobacillus isalae]
MLKKVEKYREINRLMRAYMMKLTHYFGKEASNSDLTPQQGHTLIYLSNNPGAMQRELGKYFHLRDASITNMVKNLERYGYIIRKIDEKSARIKRIYLTPAGKEKVEEIKEQLNKSNEKIAEYINDDLLERLENDLKELNASLKELK